MTIRSITRDRVLFELRVVRGWFAFQLLAPCMWFRWWSAFKWLLPSAGDWGHSEDVRVLRFGDRNNTPDTGRDGE